MCRICANRGTLLCIRENRTLPSARIEGIRALGKHTGQVNKGKQAAFSWPLQAF